MTDEITLPALPETLPVRDRHAGMAGLAAMSDEEFTARLAGLQRGQERLQRIHKTLMREGVDYGVIPGTPKPTLLKPGAEKLCVFYGLVADFSEQVDYARDGEDAPPIMVLTRCRLHLGDLDGPIVASGTGAANSWERRHRWRRGERHCPACGLVGAIIRSKEELGGGWIDWTKKGGCGAKFAANDPAITDQVVGDVENPDAFDLLNTLVKMSAKRALVDTVLRATATSALYTQDVEETAPAAPQAPQEARTAPRAAAAGKSAAPSPKAPESPDSDVADELGQSACQEPGCSRLLTAPEIRSSRKHFDGERWCQEHGRAALARQRAAAAAAVALEDELDERLAAEGLERGGGVNA
jgi:hypothetical protein